MPGVESSERWNERQADNMALEQCDRDNPLVAVGRPRPILDILRDGCDPQYGTWAPICRRAVDEIERMRTELEMWHDGNIMAESHRDELVKNADEFSKTLMELRQRVETLIAERDEVRREVCRRQKRSVVFEYALAEANRRGWDCFKEERC